MLTQLIGHIIEFCPIATDKKKLVQPPLGQLESIGLADAVGASGHNWKTNRHIETPMNGGGETIAGTRPSTLVATEVRRVDERSKDVN